MVAVAPQTIVPFVWALPLLVAAYKLYGKGDIVKAVTLISLALLIIFGAEGVSTQGIVKYVFEVAA
ncbi:MAG TPA: hypothetical protein EYH08_04040 [Pyrodictium sp.]|nr:hypothetical protein [Pyrodictium sp.]